MTKLTWLGPDDWEGATPPDPLMWNGVTFPKGEAVEVDHPTMIAKARGNRFFEVTDDSFGDGLFDDDHRDAEPATAGRPSVYDPAIDPDATLADLAGNPGEWPDEQKPVAAVKAAAPKRKR